MSDMQSVVLYTFLYGNLLSAGTLFSGGSHMGTALPCSTHSGVACHPFSRCASIVPPGPDQQPGFGPNSVTDSFN